jgi:hypothetical protein
MLSLMRVLEIVKVLFFYIKGGEYCQFVIDTEQMAHVIYYWAHN